MTEHKSRACYKTVRFTSAVIRTLREFAHKLLLARAGTVFALPMQGSVGL